MIPGYHWKWSELKWTVGTALLLYLLQVLADPNFLDPKAWEDPRKILIGVVAGGARAVIGVLGATAGPGRVDPLPGPPPPAEPAPDPPES